MRQFLYSLAKRLAYGGLLLILAMSMGFVFSDVVQAQSDPASCEVNPVPMRVPTNLFDSGVSAHVSSADNMNGAIEKLRAEVRKVPALLACGSNHSEPFFTPPLQYTVSVDKLYIKSSAAIKYQTAIVSCLPMNRSDFPSNPNSDVAAYTEPWVNFNNSEVFTVPADGVIKHNVEQVSRSFGFHSTLTANGQNYPLSALSSMWMTNQWSVMNYDNNEVIYSKLIPGQAIAITYLEYYSSLTYIPKTDLPLSDQLRRELNSYMFVAGMQALVEHTAKLNSDQEHIVDGWSGDISFLSSILDATADTMITQQDGRIRLGGMVLKLAVLLRDPLTTFIETRDQITLAELQNLYPYQYGELYSMHEVSLDNRDSVVKNKLNQLGVVAPYTRLLGVRWHASSRILEVAGSGFNRRSSVFLELRRADNAVVKTATIHAFSNNFYPQSSSYARSVYLDFGQLYTKFFFEPGATIPTGCYFISAYVWEQNQATVVTARAGNFVWIDGDPNYVPPQSIIITTSGSGFASPDRTCSNPINVLTQHANLFSAVNCTGDITWFSAHPENGPSANSSSLYVPANSVVKVSSQDGGGGETACFTSTQIDLGSWKNKIQWAQLVSGGSCPVITADSYLVHTNQGDVRINNGQTWQNTPTKQILGFDRSGSVHLKINHLNGSIRCWDDTKSAQQLQNDGDWWLQTKSITIGSGYCPGMSGQLQVFNQPNFVGSQNDIRAGNSRTYSNGDFKYSLRFTEAGMSAWLLNADGRKRCFNKNVTNLQDHEDYWRATVKIEVYGYDVCPPTLSGPAAGTFASGSAVQYSYYELGLDYAPVPSGLTATRTGTVGNFDLSQVAHRVDGYSISFKTCLVVPTTGSYTFSTISDDGSELYLDGLKIVNNDGAHAAQERSGTTQLSAGLHALQVEFWQGGVGDTLGVTWQGPGFSKQWIPNSSLSDTGCTFGYDLSSFNQYTKFMGNGKDGIFALKSDGTLYFYRHETRWNGVHLMDGPYPVGVGWNMYPSLTLLAADSRNGIYAVDAAGKLFYYQYTVQDSGITWGQVSQIGQGWTIFSRIFSNFDWGVYTLYPSGVMSFYNHQVQGNVWSSPYNAGSGWFTLYSTIFSNGLSGIYGIQPDGGLVYYRNTIAGYSITWHDVYMVGQGWNMYDQVFTDGKGGVIGRDPATGKLYFYAHNTQTQVGLTPGRFLLNPANGISPASVNEPEVYAQAVEIEPEHILYDGSPVNHLYLPLIQR